MTRVFHRFMNSLRDHKRLAYIAFGIIGTYVYFQINGFVYLVYWCSSLVLSVISDVMLAIYAKKCTEEVHVFHHGSKHGCHHRNPHRFAINQFDHIHDKCPKSSRKKKHKKHDYQCDNDSDHSLEHYHPITLAEELSVLFGQVISISIALYVNYLLTYGYLINPMSYSLLNYLGMTNMFSSSSGLSMGPGNLYNNPSMNQQSSLSTSIQQSNTFNAMVNNSTSASTNLLQNNAFQGPLGPLTPIQAAAVAASLNTPAVANPYLDPYCSGESCIQNSLKFLVSGTGIIITFIFFI